jgi:hypothetical protein
VVLLVLEPLPLLLPPPPPPPQPIKKARKAKTAVATANWAFFMFRFFGARSAGPEKTGYLSAEVQPDDPSRTDAV